MTYDTGWYEQYADQPEPFWIVERGLGAGGYEMIEAAAKRDWRAVTSWGEDGWDLGNPPYVILFARNRGDLWEVAQYCEGDINTYAFPHQAARDAALDSIAHWQWTTRGEEWVRPYPRVELMPPRLRGPYGRERQTTPRLVRMLWIPAEGRPEVRYVSPHLETFKAAVGGWLEAVSLPRGAHLYCDEEGKVRNRPVNRAATEMWWRAVPEAAGNDHLVGDVIVLGRQGAEEDDCPQWPIDELLGSASDESAL